MPPWGQPSTHTACSGPGRALGALGRQRTRRFRGVGPPAPPVPSQRAPGSLSPQRAHGVDGAGRGHGVQARAWPSPRCLSPHRSPRAGPGQADGLGGSPRVSAQAPLPALSPG
ncbi:unnamed protein product [Rangifer tarandus platyrhynchus]|uniref:Uncharacterized protein n=2 Tax=Rangifer tarandus platyrhynchus TaxID=3082113 RepID=A0ABN8Y7Y2_RANTA|nr:unnamed protein product [Rangifer tarandus platyrhynchus]CAI9695981.1 unnamed protein product [Rangifer tarandus platyrhynchus]